MTVSSEQTAEIAVGGMTCGACSAAVTAALHRLTGVSAASVSLATERATVTFRDLDVAAVVAAVEDAGFDAALVQLKPRSPSPPAQGPHKIEILVSGMTCANCSNAVTRALQGVPGVHSASVSLATDTAYVGFAGPDPQALVTAVEDAGFDAQLVRSTPQPADPPKQAPALSTLEIKLFGVTSAADQEAAHAVLATTPGVVSASVTPSHTAVVFDRGVVGARGIFRSLERAGFSALMAMTADNSQQVAALNRVKELQSYYRDAVAAFALGVPVIVINKLRPYLPRFLTARVGRGLWVDDVLALVLTVPILVGPARRFYVKAFRALRAGAPTMDVLVTTSVLCAFAYSALALVHAVTVDMPSHQMYLWDACAMILMFVLLGKYLENLARGQTSQALAELISLVPEESLVLAEDTDLRQGKPVPTDMLQVGDVVVLRPGERISADGVVVDGESFVSEALITGEAAPVRKVVGDTVVGGTINGLGSLKFRVTNCGADTKLAQIVTFIKEAQGAQTPIQRYVDVAAARFVPAVMGLALLTFLGWGAMGLALGRDRLPMMFHNQSLFFTCLRLGIAVVVVACPCALGLATPTAVMVATTVGAKHGILVKGGGIFELGAKTSMVLFDKTGTLTTGRMSVVTQSVPAHHWPHIRALEAYSEHPAGKALASFVHPDETGPLGATDAATQLAAVDEVCVQPGEGIRGKVAGVELFIGRRAQDKAVVAVVDGEVVGQIELRDSLRAEAPEVVETLQSQGFTVGILSGDGARAVATVSAELGIAPEFTWSALRPEDKVEVINTLKASGHTVAFVGDGINDSPALVAASVGMSLEGSTHVAVESADIVLTQYSPISGVPAALALCRVAMRRIKLNLFSSIVYNVVMIPFAMGLLLPFNIMLTPIMASAAMAMSSVSVVVSSLLLKTWSPDGRRSWRQFVPKLLRCRDPEYQPV